MCIVYSLILDALPAYLRWCTYTCCNNLLYMLVLCNITYTNASLYVLVFLGKVIRFNNLISIIKLIACEITCHEYYCYTVELFPLFNVIGSRLLFEGTVISQFWWLFRKIVKTLIKVSENKNLDRFFMVLNIIIS